jgi:hypothetical protein
MDLSHESARTAQQSSKVKAAGMGANGIAFMQLVA